MDDASKDVSGNVKDGFFRVINNSYTSGWSMELSALPNMGEFSRSSWTKLMRHS